MGLLLKYIKESDRNFNRIVAKVLSKNAASIKFFEKFGFALDGEETIFKEMILFYDLKE